MEIIFSNKLKYLNDETETIRKHGYDNAVKIQSCLDTLKFSRSLFMDKYYEYKPNYAVHPGRILADYLERKGSTDEEFARLIGWSLDLLSNLLSSKISVDIGMAEKLFKATKIRKKFRLDLQANYDKTYATRNITPSISSTTYHIPLSASGK
jgi:plasmid maintenance system antidote protein VapI